MRPRPTPKVLKAGRPAKPGLPEGTSARDAMWSALRAAGRLNLTEAMAVAFCDRSSARVYLTSLVAAGLAREENDGAQTFSLISDPGPNDAARSPRWERHRDRRRRAAAAWKAMRVLGTFTVRDLHAASGIAISDAKHYCKYLASAGYLIVVRQGKGGGPARSGRRPFASCRALQGPPGAAGAQDHVRLGPERRRPSSGPKATRTWSMTWSRALRRARHCNALNESFAAIAASAWEGAAPPDG